MSKNRYLTAKGVSFLKRSIQAGDNITVTADEEYIYLIQGYIAMKIPKSIYSDMLQPIVCREMPETNNGFALSHTKYNTAQHYIDIWNTTVEQATTPVHITAYIKRHQKSEIAIFSMDKKPIFVDMDLLNCFNYSFMGIRSSGQNKPLYMTDGVFEFLILPLFADKVESKMDYVIAKGETEE